MNSLLSNYYSVETQWENVKMALGDHTSMRLTADIHSIKTQMAKTTDGVITDSLKNRLKMCEAQAQNVEAIEQAYNRSALRRGDASGTSVARDAQ